VSVADGEPLAVELCVSDDEKDGVKDTRAELLALGDAEPEVAAELLMLPDALGVSVGEDDGVGVAEDVRETGEWRGG
jgi:hypothetical protein